MSGEPDVIGSLADEFCLMGHAIRAALAPAVDSHGLLPGAIVVMMVLNTRQPCRQVELAGELSITPSGLSRHISELVTAGYVVRRPDQTDGRASLIELTAKGLDLLDRAHHSRATALANALGDWDHDDVTDAVDVTRRLRTALHAYAQTHARESEPTHA
ncbi:MarR family winged helix-turn-helix transcriptional regulator [Gordonia insulae]|uniref:Putative HTH-type transcriptional regulator n=1 Tax=Gordonia insulae TaxID=2420509 RepID=A0A3G8JLS5_9ACTN|nr:MarR family winged helix-turn-helix transcriptional regulator [Gordonia insulae]AZG46026.1 putative HTH-type transcriptional regulator [Gordonia insulae]